MNRVEEKKDNAKPDEFRAQITREIANCDRTANSDRFGVGHHPTADEAHDRAVILRYVLRVYDKHYG